MRNQMLSYKSNSDHEILFIFSISQYKDFLFRHLYIYLYFAIIAVNSC